MRPRIIAISLAVVVAALLVGTSAGRAVGDEDAEKAAAALKKAVEEGSRLFRDAALGSSGRACAACHEDPEKPKLALASRAGGYPKWDRREDAVITLGQKIRQMIEKNLKGTPPELGSVALVSLEAYIASLVNAR
jgi:cytochrome c